MYYLLMKDRDYSKKNTTNYFPSEIEPEPEKFSDLIEQEYFCLLKKLSKKSIEFLSSKNIFQD